MALTLSVASFLCSQICFSSPGSQCRSPAQSFFLAPPQSDNRVRVCKIAQKSELRTLPQGVKCRRLRGFSGLRDGGVSGDVGAVNGEESSVARAQISETAIVESRNQEFSSVEDIKAALISSLEGLNRGIFGVQNSRKAEVESLLQLLEALNPSPRPTDNLEKVKGEWRLLYSTISILGSKRTKLGLRDLITLGDFLQIIDVDQRFATNKVGFSVAGLGMLSGSFTIAASYTIASPTRVNIQFERSSLVPEQLMTLFQKNFDLLLSIFNPEGWLEITYVDDTIRVGRDDKGNVFLVQRT